MKLFNIYSDFPQKSRVQAKKLLEKMRIKALQQNIQQIKNCNCGWGEIYSNRFGIPNFPCLHTVLNEKIEIQNLFLPPKGQQIKHVHVFSEIDKWDFSPNHSINLSPLIQGEIEFEHLSLEMNTKNFLIQTAK